VGVWKQNKGLHAEEAKTGAEGDLQSETRIYSPRGCHLIAMLARTERAKAFRRWVLDVLDHLVEPQQLPALPDKTADTAFENELKRAINQRAHSLSLRQFDDIRAELRRAVKKYGKGKTHDEISSSVNFTDRAVAVCSATRSCRASIFGMPPSNWSAQR